MAVTGFLKMLAICLMAFTNFYMIIQMNKKNPTSTCEEDDYACLALDEITANPQYVSDHIGTIVGELTGNFFNSFISMYLLSLGEFAELDGYSEGHDRQLAWIGFIAATLIVQLLFMNMLIAVMSTPFSIV